MEIIERASLSLCNNASSSTATATAILILLILAILILWRAMAMVWLRPKDIERRLREQGLKGNPYKPFLGDALQLFKLKQDACSKPISLSDDTLPRVLPFPLHILNKHGNNSFGWVATTPWLIVTDPDKIKEILTRYQDFQKPDHPFTKFLMVGLFGLEGEKWVKHRRIINPAFHLEKLKIMSSAMYLSCRKMIDLWEEMVSNEGCTELDVLPFIENLTGDVISRAAFGSSYEEGRKFFELLKENLSLLIENFKSSYIPGLSFLPTKKNLRLKIVSKETEALLMGLVEKRKRELETSGINKDDLLGILLEHNLGDIQHGDETKGRALTTEEVVQECKLFYLAGETTTTSLLVWSLILLSKHQVWQERARTEILQVFGKDNQTPTFDGLNQLKILNMIINEVLRLYTPAYMLLRKVFKDTNLKELMIPAGTELVIPLSILHQDVDIWGNDAKDFDPERFSEGVSRAMKGHGVFMPFSSGPRVCVGQNFALLEAKMALTLILKRFSLHLSPTYVHAPQAEFSIQPQHGANLMLCKI